MLLLLNSITEFEPTVWINYAIKLYCRLVGLPREGDLLIYREFLGLVAFDTVDHRLLLARLDNWIGIKSMALSYFYSYLHHRSFSVTIGQYSSSYASVSHGVPQGSILCLMLFRLYMLPQKIHFSTYFLPFLC